jgi:DivIVA domain-containing protein
MPLSPADVANKRFQVVRSKEDYGETDVDAFLKEVVE